MSVSPERQAQVSPRTSDIVKAVLAAHRGEDRMQVCFEILGVVMLIVDGDEQMKSSAAWFMRRCAQKLDDDLTDTTTLQ
jgi:hypothetical protein